MVHTYHHQERQEPVDMELEAASEEAPASEDQDSVEELVSVEEADILVRLAVEPTYQF